MSGISSIQNFGIKAIQQKLSNESVEFLMKEGNVAIKYRVRRDICKATDAVEYFKLRQELENSVRAKKLLECLKSRKEYHGATLQAVENSLNMLIDMGFTYGTGFELFDVTVRTLAQEVQRRKLAENHVLRYLPDIVVIPFLLRAGLRDAWMIEFVKERIDIIYSFVKQKRYDIYDNINVYKGIPKNFRERSIIWPNLYENGQIRLPLEYDVYGMACLYIELSQCYKDKIDMIISYIMDERFLQIQDTYGILSDGKHYWALGWNPKPTDLDEMKGVSPLLLKMELLSSFTIASQTKWFSQALEFMKTYEDDKGIYHYPAKYLTEKDSCWILGNHMGLGENRRRKNALELEGTFRTLIIFNNLKKLKKAVDKTDIK